MNVKVRYYLWLSARAATTEEYYSLPEGASLRDLLVAISRNKPKMRDLIEKVLDGKGELVMLVNSKHPEKGLETILMNGDVVEFLPPVSGG